MHWLRTWNHKRGAMPWVSVIEHFWECHSRGDCGIVPHGLLTQKPLDIFWGMDFGLMLAATQPSLLFCFQTGFCSFSEDSTVQYICLFLFVDQSWFLLLPPKSPGYLRYVLYDSALGSGPNVTLKSTWENSSENIADRRGSTGTFYRRGSDLDAKGI